MGFVLLFGRRFIAYLTIVVTVGALGGRRLFSLDDREANGSTHPLRMFGVPGFEPGEALIK